MSATLVLAAALAAPAAEAVAYHAPDAAAAAALEADWSRAWGLFAAVSGADPITPTLVRTADIEAAAIVACSGPSAKAGYVVPDDRIPGKRYVLLYYGSLAGWSAERRAQVLCHELLHLYFGLPDQYDAAAGQDVRPDCVMGDFLAHGWSGRLCAGCRAQVEALRRRP